MPRTIVLAALLLTACGGSTPGGGETGPRNANSSTNASSSGGDATEDPAPLVRHGVALAEQQQCPRAIAEGFEPALAIFERQAPPAGTTGTRAPGGFGPEWSDAMYLEAFCLVEAGAVDEASALLERALTLIPEDAVYSCELGHIRQGQGRFDEAMALFEGALRNASLLSNGPLAGQMLFGQPISWWERRALRGIGFTQIELGQLDEAVATYRRVLAIDPNDSRALHELQVIEERRQGR